MTLTPVYTQQTECQDCYKCIRQCPVKAIRVKDSHAIVMGGWCIACGRCVINCPAHAKRYRNDVDAVKDLLQKKKRVIVSLGPSFMSEFPDFAIPTLIAALKKLGFSDVSECALGADFVTAKMSSILAQADNGTSTQKLFISSICPAAVEYIKHYMSEYAPYITDISSPLLTHARYLRKVYGNDIGVVFIGPCISKKREADVWEEIDNAITYKELRKWFDKEGITAKTVADQAHDKNNTFIPRRAAKSELYCIEGGMIEAMHKYQRLAHVKTLSVSGIEGIHETLHGLDVQALDEPLFLELHSCYGSCISGPGNVYKRPLAMRKIDTINFAKTADEVLDQKTLDNAPKMTGVLPAFPILRNHHTEDQITTALHSIGKYTKEEEINCSGCGYETCRHFAVAMLDGIAEKTMCVSYMRKLAQKKANALVTAIPSGVVIVDKYLSIVECNKNFATLMGSAALQIYEKNHGLEGTDLASLCQNTAFFTTVLNSPKKDVIEKEAEEGKKIMHFTVFTIEKGELAAAVIDDVTTPMMQKKQTITQARKVIEKNLSVVQKIAFLLGENAAETESILNSVIQSYEKDR